MAQFTMDLGIPAVVAAPRKPAASSYAMHRLCDDRCTYATGNDCECSCGGKNHGVNAK